MIQTLRLHYAPDNASLCVRLALQAQALPYDTVLVDRSRAAQRDSTYLALNPNGLIPVLETQTAVMFETGAILLWLADQSPGTLMPAHDADDRGTALTWHMWLANTLHPALRMLFYPQVYFPSDVDGLRVHTRKRLTAMLHLLDQANPAFLTAPHATAQGCYLAPMLRWAGLYGGDTSWFDLNATPALKVFAETFEAHDFARISARAEGLGDTPFSAPRPAQPPEGTAL